MKLRLHEYNLPLTHPFTISRGTITVQGTLIVELQQKWPALIAHPDRARLSFGDTGRIESALIELGRSRFQIFIEIACAITSRGVGRCGPTGVVQGIRCFERRQRGEVRGIRRQCDRTERGVAIRIAAQQHVG